MNTRGPRSRGVRLLEAPLDSGHWGTRMGRGPGTILGAAAEWIAGTGVEVERVVTASPLPTEIATAFELNRRISGRVRAAIWKGRLPIVLAGNCLSSIGTVAGIRRGPVGVIWLDAHADFHTPETTTSGFADGTALAALVGRCWKGVADSVDGFTPVDPRDVVLVGARDLDPAEPAALEEAGVAWIRAERVGDLLTARLQALAPRVQQVYLHIDLDVLDPSIGSANAYAAPGGLTVDETRQIVSLVRAHFRIAAAALTAYDPAYDTSGAIAGAAVELLRELSA